MKWWNYLALALLCVIAGIFVMSAVKDANCQSTADRITPIVFPSENDIRLEGKFHYPVGCVVRVVSKWQAVPKPDTSVPVLR